MYVVCPCVFPSFFVGVYFYASGVQALEARHAAQAVAGEAARKPQQAAITAASTKRMRFTDRDEHMYFWFPLLAGLSELTFDPRQEIRQSALEVRHPG